MDSFAHDALVIETANDEQSGVLQLRWRGTSRAREPSKTLSPYLATAIGWAAEKGVALEMRFGELEFFNSATVMAIIKSAHVAREKGVRLRIVYASDVAWQRLSFDPMKVLVKGDLFEIIPRGKGEAS